MKTLIVGTGVIGVIYGWALAEAGVDVSHVVRSGKKARCADGLKLDLLDERKNHPKYNQADYALRCTEQVEPQDGYELVIVPTNLYQVEPVIKEYAPACPQAVFLILSSNWDGPASIDALLPRPRYLLGYPDGGGTVRDGLYWTNLGAEIHLGLIEGNDPHKLEALVALFKQADMSPDVQPDILHWLWVHNASTVGFAAGFAKYNAVDPFLKDGGIMKRCMLATQELMKLCRLRGVNLKNFPEVGFVSWPTFLSVAMMRYIWTHNESMQRFTAHAAAESSLKEARLSYEAMARTAQEFNFEMPHLKNLSQYFYA